MSGDESAINIIANEWLFKPGTLDGKPVNVRANIEISFRLPKRWADSGEAANLVSDADSGLP
jgi:hypothetical protein